MIQAPTHINDEQATAATIPVEENINESTDADYQPEEVALEIPKAPSHENEEEEEENQAMPNPLSEINEPITTIRTNENVIDGPTPIETSEILKLETEVDKTIENANNVIDVVIPPIQQEDKLLEEIVHMISNSPESLTTTLPPSTTDAPITVTYHQKHHHHHHHHEVESEELTTIFDENVGKTTIDLITIPSSTTTATAVEAETINIIHNNEEHHHHHHTNAFDEKLPIVIELTTTTTTTVSEITKLNEKLFIDIGYEKEMGTHNRTNK